MCRRHLLVSLLGAALALVSSAANAQQFQGQSPTLPLQPELAAGAGPAEHAGDYHDIPAGPNPAEHAIFRSIAGAAIRTGANGAARAKRAAAAAAARLQAPRRRRPPPPA